MGSVTNAEHEDGKLMKTMKRKAMMTVLCAVSSAMIAMMGRAESKAPEIAAGQPKAQAKGTTTGTFVEVVEVKPASPATLKAGERANVKVRYQCMNAEKVRIWVQPYTKGRHTPDGFYAPSAAEPAGPGEVQRFVGLKSEATVDELRVSMVDAESRKQLAKASFPVNLKWKGSLPKPETVAPVGKPFPGLKFTSVQGQEIDVAKMKGKVVLIDFWATWCGPCKQEIPNLVATYEKYHRDGFEIVGISLDRSKEALQKYIQENKMPWPEYFDGKMWQNEISRKFAVDAIPCSYLIGREGVVRYISLRGQQLTKAVAKLVE